MSWWLAIPAVLTTVGTIMQSKSASSQNANQLDWNTYNADMQYKTDLDNIRSATAITALNAAFIGESSKLEIANIKAVTDYNVQILNSTNAYNDLLYEEELTSLWDITGLDIELLEQERLRERGGIIANQAASGTVIDEGSNADVIADSMTQEALDIFIIERGADIEANTISNARAKSAWEGEMAIQNTLWNGQISSYYSAENAKLSQISLIGQDSLKASADERSAEYRRISGISSAENTYNYNETSIENNFMSGMFQAVGQGVAATYQSRVPASGTSLLL